MRRAVLGTLMGIGFGAILGCDQQDSANDASRAAGPEAITTEECAACGMVVREQPAPRAQVVHRDGTREAFCSLSDLAHYLQAPSPHGEVVRVFVEVLDPEHDPSETNPAERPWVAASEASFVLGVEREGIMGPPVLAYRSSEEAKRVAERHDGEVVDFTQVRKQVIRP